MLHRWARLAKAGKLLIYETMYRSREVELTIRKDVKTQSNTALALTSIGEEAVSVGAAFSLLPSRDFLFAGHRHFGALTHFGVTPLENISNHMCKADSPMRGRDGNIHYAFINHKRNIGKFISDMIANWGAALGVAEGLKYKYLNLEAEVFEGKELPFVLCFCGDGASRQGILHEIVNCAAVRNLPIGFVINNNAIATDTPIEEQMATEQIYKLADGYGIIGRYVANGNDVITVFDHAADLIQRAREIARLNLKGKPELRAAFILEADTFRMDEHNSARFAHCVDPNDFSAKGAQDPLMLYRLALLNFRNVEVLKQKNRDPMAMFDCRNMEIKESEIIEIEERVKAEVAEAYAKAVAMPNPKPSKELLKIFPTDVIIPKTREVEPFNAKFIKEVSGKDRKTMISGVEAMKKVLVDVMLNDPRIRIFGEDVAGRVVDGEIRGGGVQGITSNVIRHPDIKSDRIFNTPLAETAIAGLAIGQALVGILPIAEFQYLPFSTVALGQLLNYLPSLYWTLDIPVHVIFRLPCGGRNSSGEFHSSMRLEATYFHTPGLKMIEPSTPNDFTGLMLSAVKDNAPILFFENLWGMRSVLGEVTGKPIPIGLAALRKLGKDLTIVSWGGGAWFDAVLPAVERLEEEGKSIELIDMRTLAPLDLDLIVSSVKKTHRLLIVHDDIEYGGVGQSISHMIQHEAIDHLLARIEVLGAKRCLFPQHRNLEQWYLPSREEVLRLAKELLERR